MERIIGLIDMDCFYAQVEQRDKPELWGKPVIVVQHSRRGVQGGILAVSYEARGFGVKRGMTVAEAKQLCPDLATCLVPIGEYADKADIQKYRNASAEVFDVLNNFDSNIVVEKASVDEAFLDLSIYVDNIIEKFKEGILPEFLPSSHIADGHDKNENDDERISRISTFLESSQNDISLLRLAIAALTIEQIRKQIRDKTQFFCSAGIANNKMMAKLVCARHKPRQQTIVPFKYVREILKTTPIRDVRGFGGKMGQKIQERLNIMTMGEILSIDFNKVVESFPDEHEWLLSVAEGYDSEPVKARSESSSIAVSKNFPGRNAINMVQELRQWLDGLTKELAKRLVTDQLQNKRTAENLVFALATEDGRPQKTLKLVSYHPDILIDMLWKAIKPLNKASDEQTWHPKIYNLYLGATKFVPGIPTANRDITEWLNSKGKKSSDEPLTDEIVFVHEEKKVYCPQPSTSRSDSVIVLDDDDDDEKEVPITEDDEEYIEVDGKRFSKTVFKNLPVMLRKQYEHKIALETARKLKMNAKSSRKRGNSLVAAEQSHMKKHKPLTSFFRKK
ncbi:unnamed protein product [Caenorhabditis bovis]|uniref:DNA polymerase eta n=1 Tax=Caenorhabditis bovis TaxID=2654633 RepID=A0A8S1EQD0_9PELO|nr:unnamed protein product [Caenorhabditis bovis]